MGSVMNGVDVAIAAALVVSALRGYWRGFVRETFALIALIGGVVLALRLASVGEGLVQAYVPLPSVVAAGAAFVAIFVVVHVSVNLVGVLLSRLARSPVLRVVNGAGGAVLGAGKGATVIAFLLLFLHLFPFVPALDSHIMASTVGRPLVAAASNLLRVGAPTGSERPASRA